MLAPFILRNKGSRDGFRPRVFLSRRCSGGSLDPFLAPALTSTNPVPSVLKTALNPSIPPAHAIHAPTSPLPRTHTNAGLPRAGASGNPIPFIGLLHSSLDTPGVGVQLWLIVRHAALTYTACPEKRRGASRSATIPFRIIFFAHPHPLTPIESYSCKKHRGGGLWDSLSWLSPPAARSLLSTHGGASITSSQRGSANSASLRYLFSLPVTSYRPPPTICRLQPPLGYLPNALPVRPESRTAAAA